MNLNKVILLFISSIIISSCADYKIKNINQKDEKQYFSSMGFALIYEDSFYKEKMVNKKINNEKFQVIHNFLRTNTPIKIINPDNLKFVETKVYKKGYYPKIFNAVISKKVATYLEIDTSNPYIEIMEVKKNKTFIAKQSKIFEEEKNVAEKAPVDNIKMDNLIENDSESNSQTAQLNSFILVISDFYYLDSADNLKKKLIEKTKSNNISVKKINNKKYRLLAGPFESFNALKTIYISLNNLGFENLNIYRE